MKDLHEHIVGKHSDEQFWTSFQAHDILFIVDCKLFRNALLKWLGTEKMFTPPVVC